MGEKGEGEREGKKKWMDRVRKGIGEHTFTVFKRPEKKNSFAGRVRPTGREGKYKENVALPGKKKKEIKQNRLASFMDRREKREYTGYSSSPPSDPCTRGALNVTIENRRNRDKTKKKLRGAMALGGYDHK